MPPVAAAPVPPLPWWRFFTGWLAFGLPVAAVVASTLSAVIAVRGADPVVEERRPAAHQTAEHGPQAQARLPAEFARNHASMHR